MAFYFKFGFCLMFSFMGASLAFSQTLPSSVEPGRYEKEFEDKVLPKFEEYKHKVTVKRPLENDGTKFYLSAVIVKGSTIYTDDDFTPLYENLLAKKITFKDLEYIADLMTAKYRNDGYVLSKVVIPPQETADGIIYFNVIEGRVDRVLSADENIKLTDLMNEYASKISDPKITNIAELERYLLLMNDLPGVEVKGTLLPAKIKHASDIQLKIKEKKLSGRLTVDNWGTKFLGPIQTAAFIEGNNFSGKHEQTSLRFVKTARSSELRYFELTEKMPVGDNGTTVQAKMRYSRSSPGSNLQGLDIKSRSTNFTFTVKHPIIHTRAKNIYAWATIEHQQSKVTSFGNKLSEDRLRMIRFGGSFDWVDSYSGVNMLNIEGTYGADVFGASQVGADALSRGRGVGNNFYKATLDMARLQKLTNKLNVLGYLTGQFASHSLLAAEEFGFGGASFGKGYDPSEITGDHGAAIKVEAQYNGKSDFPWLKNYQAFSAYDIGVVMNKDRLATETMEKTAASFSVGVRSYLKYGLSASFEIAKPLTRGVQSQGENQKNATFFVRLGKDF